MLCWPDPLGEADVIVFGHCYLKLKHLQLLSRLVQMRISASVEIKSRTRAVASDIEPRHSRICKSRQNVLRRLLKLR